MKCVICRSDNIRTQQVYEEFYRGDDIVRLPLEVPVCAIAASATTTAPPCATSRPCATRFGQGKSHSRKRARFSFARGKDSAASSHGLRPIPHRQPANGFV